MSGYGDIADAIAGWSQKAVDVYSDVRTIEQRFKKPKRVPVGEGYLPVQTNSAPPASTMPTWLMPVGLGVAGVALLYMVMRK